MAEGPHETVKLPTRIVEKPWGRETLPAPFSAPEGKRIGEVWFEPPEELPDLLVKYIFTSEKLSVQCHPSDAQAQAIGPGRQGKEECWLVTGAEPGARLGIGFREELDATAMRAAALDGSIEDKLAWFEVRPGNFFYIPAGTVHAIGAGVSIIEIQQNSSTTYRLYDYGRDRELHLDEGIEVADGRPYDPANRNHAGHRSDVGLVDGPIFRVDQLAGGPDPAISARYRSKLLVIPREGEVAVQGERVRPGECALAPEIDAVTFAPEGTCLIAQPVPA